MLVQDYFMSNFNPKQAQVKLEKKIDQHDEIVSGLKRLYSESIEPLERMCLFEQFHSPPLRGSDFEANPMVMLLGFFFFFKEEKKFFYLFRSIFRGKSMNLFILYCIYFILRHRLLNIFWEGVILVN
jgi:hypothetical protein